MYLAITVLFFLVSASHQANVKRDPFDNGLGYQSYPISLISDQDKATKINDTDGGISWFSTLVSANLLISKNGSDATVKFLNKQNFTSKYNYDGRGMELSDLKRYNETTLTVDDKTGIIYRIQGETVIPWVILADSDGNSEKPFKGEWLAVKDTVVYCGGYGKEMTLPNGSYIDDSPFWVKAISPDGGIRTLNWRDNFIKLRKHLEINFPGYVIHESAQWSNIHKRWFFLPRHMSKLHFTYENVHTTGANVLLMATEDFSNITHVFVGQANTPRGFSAFQFVPGTNDEQIVALKSVEAPKQPLNSFIMVFDVTGKILMDEMEIPGNLKCEGIEFYDAQLEIYPFIEVIGENNGIVDHTPLIFANSSQLMRMGTKTSIHPSEFGLFTIIAATILRLL